MGRPVSLSGRAEAEASLSDFLVSPSGSLAAYRSNESAVNEIYIRSLPDPGMQMLVSQGGGAVPSSSPDASTLYCTRASGAAEGAFMAVRLE